MLLSSRIPTRELAQLCHRLAISVDAGIDSRKTWAGEAARTKGPTRSRIEDISQSVKKGESLCDALGKTGEYFPVLFREMVAVGEHTGRLDSIFSLLAEHYEERLRLRRQFLAAIAWPVIELTLAFAAIGFLILVTGWIRTINPEFDPLGVGLYGASGLAIYLACIGGLAAIGWVIILAIGRGMIWTRPIQYAVMKIPMLGKAIETLSLARLAWSLNITLHSGMEIRRALRLSLASTNNAKYTSRIDVVDGMIEQGDSILEAFIAADCFPAEFLDATAVGEQSGKLDDTMAVLSRQYHEQARFAMKTLNSIAAFLVWIIIASIIITMIFRLASSYIGAINQAGRGL